MVRYVEIGEKVATQILCDTKMNVRIIKCIRHKENYYHSNPYCEQECQGNFFLQFFLLLDASFKFLRPARPRACGADPFRVRLGRTRLRNQTAAKRWAKAQIQLHFDGISSRPRKLL